MIFLYSGTPGSGKSLHTADVILHGLQRGRPIICNFDVAHDIKGRKYFTYCPNEKLSPEFLIQYSKESKRRCHIAGNRRMSVNV